MRPGLSVRTVALALLLALVLNSCPDAGIDLPDGGSGDPPNGSPTIVVRIGDHVCASDDTIDLGSTTVGSPKSVDVTLENTGTADLHMDGSPAVSVSGTDTDSFSVSTQPSTTIAAGSQSVITIEFAPQSAGDKTATLSFTCDDAVHGDWSLTLTGTGTLTPEPEAVVRTSLGVEIESGTGSYDFGDGWIGVATGREFIIENAGDADLTLGGTPVVALSGTNAGDFSVTVPPTTPVTPATSRTFTIEFTASGTGTRTASVSIATNDGDENPYTFTISGTGVAVPQIALVHDGSPVSDGGSITVGSVTMPGYRDLEFTVRNTGDGTLVLTGSPFVGFGGGSSAAYSVQSQPTTPIASGGSASFTIRFEPTIADQSQAALVVIPSNDPTNGAFDVFLTGGYGRDAEIAVLRNGTAIADGGTTGSLGSTMQGSSTDYVFTIENLDANAELRLDESTPVELSGTDAAAYSIVAEPATTIAALSSTTFTLRFAPVGTGTYTATVSIANNDPDENPYDFTVSATASEWHGTRLLRSGVGEASTMEYYYYQGTNQLGVMYYDSNDERLEFLMSDSGAYGSWWTGSPVTVSSVPGITPDYVFSGASVYAAYHDAASFDLEFARSDGTAGATWPTHRTVDAAGTSGTTSSIIKDYNSGATYISYYDATGSDLRFARSTDSGASWASIAVDGDGTPATSAGHVSALGFGSSTSTLYLAYYHFEDSAIKFTSSINSGTTWSSPVTVGSAGTTAGTLSLWSSGSTIYLTYYDATNGDMRFARSTNAGVDWTTVLVDSAGDAGLYSSLAVNGTTIYVAYYDATNGELQFAVSTDSGATWPAASMRTVDTTGDAGRYPSIVFYQGTRVYISYTSEAGTDTNLMFAKSVNGGATW